MKPKPIYFIRTKREFTTLMDASDFFTEHGYPTADHQVGYHIPQPRYKAWVPRWVIRLITLW